MTLKIERIVPGEEVDVLVELPDQGVTLHFRNINGGEVWKVGSTFHYGKSGIVPRPDFISALALARKVIAGTAPELGGLTDAEIARHILELARRKTYSVEMALQVFFETAKWCSRLRIPSIMSEIGKIGGIASKLRSLRRKLAEELAEEQKDKEGRQLKLF